MKLVPITKPMPEIIWEVYEKVIESMSKLKEFNPSKDVVIGGGCLSNSYMDKPFSDVDVFVQFHESERENYPIVFKNFFGEDIEIITINKGDNYSSLECPMIYRFKYKDMPVEIIFNIDINRVYDFDIRLRQFYLQDHQVFASEKALEDIESKLLALSCPYTPIRTLVRMFRFKHQLGFEIDKESMDVILSLLGGSSFEYDYFKHLINTRKKIDQKAIDELEDLIQPYLENNMVTFPQHPFPYHSSVFKFFKQLSESGGIVRNMFDGRMGVVGKYFEKIKAYKPEDKKTVDGYFVINWYERKDILTFLLKQMKPFVLKNRLSMIFDNRKLAYTAQKQLQEQKEIALEQIKRLKKALAECEDKFDEVFSESNYKNTSSKIKQKNDWFNDVFDIFNRICSYYNPNEIKYLEGEEFKQIYTDFYNLAYRNDDLEPFISKYIYGEEKERIFFLDLVNIFSCNISEIDVFNIVSLLFCEKPYLPIYHIDTLSVSSLKEQIEEGYHLYAFTNSSYHFEFLVKEEDGRYLFKNPSLENEFWLNDFLFELSKAEFANIKDKSEVDLPDNDPFGYEV